LGAGPPRKALVPALGAWRMADRHTIVVCVAGGKVDGVLFCSCCPPLTVEVRTYTDDMDAATSANPAWYMEGGDAQPSQFQRDARGVYEATHHEPDADDE